MTPRNDKTEHRAQFSIMLSIFQTPEWEKFKLATGYQKSTWVDGVLVLIKKLPFGGAMMYSPRVGQDKISNIKNKKYLEQIKEIAKKEKAIFYRLELDIPIKPATSQESGPTSEVMGAGLITDNYIKSFEEMQPEHTLILNLDQTEEEILAQMKQKGRYNIKIAERSGITVKTSKSINNFYKLYETMAKRQRISYRGQDYFQKLVDILGEKDYILVFEACLPAGRQEPYEYTNTANIRIDESTNRATKSTSQESEPTSEVRERVLASAIVSFYGDRATYLFGGSSDQNRNLMAPYLLHWEIIKYAKAKGFKEYDFFGIAPEGALNHPWSGVTRFKEQFGGQREDILGSYDLVFNKIKYQAFKMAEKIRRKTY